LAEQVPPDDTYLFQTALAGGAETIITTDGRLVEAVTRANDYGIQLVRRDDHYQSLGI
jgi:predicted nucleic acid-binding protein